MPWHCGTQGRVGWAARPAPYLLSSAEPPPGTMPRVSGFPSGAAARARLWQQWTDAVRPAATGAQRASGRSIPAERDGLQQRRAAPGRRHFTGTPSSDMAACLPPAPLPSLTHRPARAPRTTAAAMSPRPAYGSRRRSGRAAPTDGCRAPRPRWEEHGPVRALSKMADRARDPLVPL